MQTRRLGTHCVQESARPQAGVPGGSWLNPAHTMYTGNRQPFHAPGRAFSRHPARSPHRSVPSGVALAPLRLDLLPTTPPCQCAGRRRRGLVERARGGPESGGAGTEVWAGQGRVRGVACVLLRGVLVAAAAAGVGATQRAPVYTATPACAAAAAARCRHTHTPGSLSTRHPPKGVVGGLYHQARRPSAGTPRPRLGSLLPLTTPPGG